MSRIKDFLKKLQNTAKQLENAEVEDKNIVAPISNENSNNNQVQATTQFKSTADEFKSFLSNKLKERQERENNNIIIDKTNYEVPTNNIETKPTNDIDIQIENIAKSNISDELKNKLLEKTIQEKERLTPQKLNNEPIYDDGKKVKLNKYTEKYEFKDKFFKEPESITDLKKYYNQYDKDGWTLQDVFDLVDDAKWTAKDTISNSATNVATSIAKGVAGVGEGISDFGKYTYAQLADWAGELNGKLLNNTEGKEELKAYAEEIRDEAAKNSKFLNKLQEMQEDSKQNSLFGEKPDRVGEGIGSTLPTAVLALATAGTGTVAQVANMAASAITGLSSAGNSLTESYQQRGKLDALAWAKAGAEGGLSVAIEKSGGILSNGVSYDSVIANKISPYVKSSLGKQLVDLGMSSIAEGNEEVVEYMGNTITNNLSNAILDIVKDKGNRYNTDVSGKEIVDNFVYGALSAFITQGGIKLGEMTVNNVLSNDLNNIAATKDTNNTAEEFKQYLSDKIQGKERINIDENNTNTKEVLAPLDGKFETIRTSAEKFKDYFNSNETMNKVVSSLEKLQEIRNRSNKNGKLSILFDNTIKGNGVIIMDNKGNRTIKINPESNNAVEFILMHELTHDIKLSEEYKELQEIIGKYNSHQFSFDEAKANLMQTYQDFYEKNNLDMSKLDIDEEATADVIGTLFGDQNFINQLSVQKPNLFQRLKNWINKQITIYKSSDKETTRFLFEVKERFEKALRSNNSEINNVKYSIQTDSNGEKYVKVDTDQHIFEGIDKKDYSKIAKMYMQDYLMGTTRLSNEDVAIIDSRTTNKYTNPRQENKYMSEKMKLTPELKNVLEISQKSSISAPTKANSKYRNWEYYKFKFELDGINFEGTVNIGIDKNGKKHFYEINKIHTTSNSSVSTNKSSSTDFINNSIAPIKTEVNTTNSNSTQEKKKYSQESKDLWKKYLLNIDKNTGQKERTYLNKNIASIGKDVYNNVEVINGDRYKKSDARRGNGLYEKREQKKNRKYNQEEYDNWEKSIKPISQNQLTQKERQLIYKAKEEYNKDVIIYDETNNDNTYSAGASRTIKNKIIVSKQKAEYFGLNKMVAHEIVESDIMFNDTAKDLLEPIIDIIKEDNKFIKQKEEFWKNQQNNIPSDDLIAKDILCDRFSEIITNEELDYDNLLSNATNSIIDNALTNYYKEVYDKELEISSSFNFMNEESNKLFPINKSIEDIENNNFENITNTRIIEKRKKTPTIKSTKEAVKNTKDQLIQKIVNKLQPIDKLAEKSKNLELKFKADKAQASSGIGQYNIGIAQTDLNGRKIGKSLNEVFKDVKDRKTEKDFSEYMYLKHNSDREAIYKPIFGEDISSQTSNKLAKKYEEKYPEFKKYANDVYKYLDNEMNMLAETGMLDKQTVEYLKNIYPYYVPVERVLDNNVQRTSEVITSGNGIKKATGGNTNIMTLSEAMAARTMKIRRAIVYNDLIKELSKTIKNLEIENEQAPLAGDFDIDTLFDAENAPVQEIDGKYKALYFENGEGYQFEISKELYDALKPNKIYDLENTLPFKFVQKASKLHRDMLTKFSLTFPMKNAIKDIQDVALNSRYLSKFPKNYIKAIKEIKTDGELYNLYMANGGGNNTYFDYEKGIQKTDTKNPIKWSGEKIASVNEIIEQLPRLTEFISTLEDGKSINEALYNAADITTNFKRGGDIAKALNRNGATFLNASIQGFDKFYRNFSGQNGIKGYVNIAAKAVVFGMMPALLNHLLYSDDEDYKDLRSSDKNLYYLFKYDDGRFIRIPKGRALSVFGTAARRTLSYKQGEEDAFDGMFETMAEQVAPNNPMESNVLAPIIQAKTNKTWYGGDIVSSKLQDELAKNQYDESTDDFSIWLGNKINISPKKINYVIDQYSGGVGDVLLPIATKKASNKGNVFMDQFTTDSVLKNKNESKFFETIENQTKIVNDSNSTEDDKLKLMYLEKVRDETSDLYKQKREIQLSDMSNKDKSEKVREIQKRINEKMKSALNSYENIKKDTEYTAKIEDSTYLKTEGKWKKVSDTDKEKIENISNKGGTEADYLKYKTDNKYTDEYGSVKTKSKSDRIKYLYESNMSDKSKKAIYENEFVGEDYSGDKAYGDFKGNINTYLKYKSECDNKKVDSYKTLSKNEKIDVLLNSNFKSSEISQLYEATMVDKDDVLYSALKKSNIDIKEYLKYKQQKFNTDKKDDGTLNGKNVSGSSKKKQYAYVNSMNIKYEQKLLLLGSKYKLNDNERTKLANYINSELKMSKKEKMELYSKMQGFTVYKSGRVTW